MARLPIPGSDTNIWGSVLNDFLLTTLHPDGTPRRDILETALGSTFVPFTESGGIAVGGGVFNGPLVLPADTLTIGTMTEQTDAKLHIETSSDQPHILLRHTNGAGNTTATIVSQVQTTVSRVFQAGVSTDSVNRISIEASGLVEWGAGGSSSRDTNLYRGGADTLRTDDAFKALQIEVGPSAGFGNGLSMMRDSVQVGRIDNNQVAGGGMRLQAMTGNLQLRGSANSGMQITASAVLFDSSMQLGFFGATPTAKPTGVAVSAAGIHAALVNLGLIAP